MSLLLRTAALALFTLVGAGCAAETTPEEESLGTTQEAITNGKADDADPAVVALLVDGQVFCTGVLVTKTVVATAGHCMSPKAPDTVYFGADPSTQDGTFIKVSDTLVHPDFDEETLDNDVALVGLATEAPVAPAAVLTRKFDPSFVGLKLRLVGFGATDPNDITKLRKRSGASSITSYEAGTFRFRPSPSQTCNGDSGGPAFATVGGHEYVVGLTSSGDGDCDQYGKDTRVDAFVPFITSYAKAYSAALDEAEVPVPSAGCSTSRGSTRTRGAPLLALALAALIRRRRRGARTGSGRARREEHAGIPVAVEVEPAEVR